MSAKIKDYEIRNLAERFNIAALLVNDRMMQQFFSFSRELLKLAADRQKLAERADAHDDLVDVLKNVLSDLEIGAHPHLHIEQIRAALSKAQGA